MKWNNKIYHKKQNAKVVFLTLFLNVFSILFPLPVFALYYEHKKVLSKKGRETYCSVQKK